MASKHQEILAKSFNKFDADGSGEIDAEELINIVKDLNLAETDEAAKAMAEEGLEFLDKDNNGNIDLEEFTKWYQFAWKNQLDTKVDDPSEAKRTQAPPRRRSAGSRKSSVMVGASAGASRGSFKKRGSKAAAVRSQASMRRIREETQNSAATTKREIYKKVFEEIDADNSGEVDADELPLLFSKLGWTISDEAIAHALSYLDEDSNGNIDLDEFMKLSKYAWEARIKAKKDEAELGSQNSFVVTKGMGKLPPHLRGKARAPSNGRGAGKSPLQKARKMVDVSVREEEEDNNAPVIEEEEAPEEEGVTAAVGELGPAGPEQPARSPVKPETRKVARPSPQRPPRFAKAKAGQLMPVRSAAPPAKSATVSPRKLRRQRKKEKRANQERVARIYGSITQDMQRLERAHYLATHPQ